MSGSSASEINLKQTLRKLEYPLSAQEALKKIGELLCARVANIKSMDLSLDLMAEFVFYETDRRGNKRNQALTPLVELQLLDILFDFLNNIPNETARNTLFLNLFSPTTASLRLGILSKLVSLAIGISSPNILMCASTWMQQLGSTSNLCCKLAVSLVFDYAYLAPNPEERLKVLPNIAPEFTANFLTAIADNYFVAKKQPMFPPDVLLKCITDWITGNVNLCIAAQQRQLVLPSGAIPMEATTPFAGLLRWCVLSSIYNQEQTVYSQLYLALLNSIANIPTSSPPRAINAQNLSAIVHPLISHFQDIKGREGVKFGNILNDPKMQLALDRLGQAIQVALSVNGVYGNLEELLTGLRILPFNKLLNIVLNKYKQNKMVV